MMQATSKIKLVPTGICPVCRQPNSRKLIFELSRTSVYRCGCGLEYIDPSLDEASMIAIYTCSETLKEINPALENYYEYTTLRAGSQTFKDYMEALEAVAKWVPGRDLMEVGCGTGGFLQFAKEKGWNVFGIDSSSENISKLAEKGIEGSAVPFLAASAERKFDVIVFWDLIEHPQDPFSFIQKSKDLLRPGGLVLIAAPHYPNLLSVVASWFYRLSGGKIKRPAEKLYFLEHTSYFSVPTMGALLEKGDLQIVKSWKTETDLDRYVFPEPLKTCLRVAFIVARLLGLQNRLHIIARKKSPS